MRHRHANTGFHRRWASTALLALFGVYGAFGPSIHAATYYVRTTGNDSNSGLSSGTAFRTIDRARFAMHTGDTCYIGAGTYHETVRPNRDGNVSNPIRFIGDTAGTYTGDSGNVILASSTTWCIEGNWADYNRFENIIFQPTTSGASSPVGIRVVGCHKFALVNCTFRDLQLGVVTESCDASIATCQFENISTYPIQCARGDVLVTNSTITGAGSYAAYHTWTATSNDVLTLRNCTITNNAAGPYISNTQLVLDNCTIEQNSGWGVSVVDGTLTTMNMTGGIRFNGGGLLLAQSTVPSDYYNGDSSPTNGGPDHHVITGLNLSDNATYGLYASNCNIRLLNCTIENTPGYAIGLAYTELRDATGTVVRNNAQGVACWTNAQRPTVAIDRLTMSDNAGNAIVVNGDDSIADDKLELTNSIISGHTGWGCYVEHASVECSNTRLENNASGVRIWQPAAGPGLGNCEFTDCVLSEVTNSDALYAYYSNLSISSSTISNVQQSGVQTWHGSLTIENSTITNVGQTDGYAVYHHHPGPVTLGSPILEIRATEISDNAAGIYADRTNVQLDSVTIENNRSWALAVNYGHVTWTGAGAGIVSNNDRGLYIAGNTPEGTERRLTAWQFTGNDDYGVYAVDCNLVLENCTVQGMAGWGLGIAYATLEAVNTSITNNGKGVAIYSDAAQPLPLLRNVTITGNLGTGVMHESVAERPATATLQNCTVTSNSGWGLQSLHGDIVCEATTFDDNTRGIYLERDPAIAGAGSHLFKNTIVRDVAETDGLYCTGASLRTEHCTIENIALSGVVCHGEDFTASYCSLLNTSSTDGYAVYHHYPSSDPLQRGQTRLDNCTITGNDNGPYAHYTDLTIDNCTITGNRRWGIISAYGELIVEAAERSLHGNGNGLYVAGNPSNDQRLLEGWDVSNNECYGIYAVDCDLQMTDCVIEQMTDWGLGVVNATVTAVNSPVQGNGRGVEVTSSIATRLPRLVDLEVGPNSGVAIQHISDPANPRTLSLIGGSVHDNGGDALISDDADLHCTGTQFLNNVRGLRLIKPAAARGQGGHQLQNVVLSGTLAGDGFYSEYADVQMTGCTVQQNTGHGVACFYGALIVENGNVSGNIADNCYGIYHSDGAGGRADWAHLLVKDSVVAANFGGVYGDQSHITIQNTVFEDNQQWALGCAHGDLEFVNQTSGIHQNGSGLLVIGNTDGTTRQLTNLDVSDNEEYGIFAVDCDLVLEHCQVHSMQSWGLGLSNASLRTVETPVENNGHGIHVQTLQGGRDALLENVHVLNSQGYGVYHETPAATPGVIRLWNCRLESYGQYGLVSEHGALEVFNSRLVGDPARSENGIYLFEAPQATIDRVSILGHLNWALLSYNTPLVMRNSVLAHSDGGLYFHAYDSEPTSATVLNSTFAENLGYGLVQYRGTTALWNNIFAASAGSVGVQVTEGATMHGHNLLSGYDQPWVGSTMADGDILGTPRFVNPAAGDFHLLGSSMAINRGADLPGQTDADFEGNARPMFGKWEIGAYEYTSPSESAHVIEWQELK